MTHVGNQTLVLSWIAPGDDLDTGTGKVDFIKNNTPRELKLTLCHHIINTSSYSYDVLQLKCQWKDMQWCHP